MRFIELFYSVTDYLPPALACYYAAVVRSKADINSINSTNMPVDMDMLYGLSPYMVQSDLQPAFRV